MEQSFNKEEGIKKSLLIIVHITLKYSLQMFLNPQNWIFIKLKY